MNLIERCIHIRRITLLVAIGQKRGGNIFHKAHCGMSNEMVTFHESTCIRLCQIGQQPFRPSSRKDIAIRAEMKDGCQHGRKERVGFDTGPLFIHALAGQRQPRKIRRKNSTEIQKICIGGNGRRARGPCLLPSWTKSHIVFQD